MPSRVPAMDLSRPPALARAALAFACMSTASAAWGSTAQASQSSRPALKERAEETVAAIRERLPLQEWLPGASDLLSAILLHVDYWILILTAGFFAARMAQRSHNRRLRAAKSAMAHARARDARYTSVETGMLEWINHVLRHEWRAVIGVQVDAQAKRTMQSVMSDANAMSGGIVRSATVEELTFGVVPPDLRMYVSRYNPAEDYLQFEFDMTWNTVSSHILVRATVQPTDLLPPVTVPIHVTDFAISGRLLVGFRLTQRIPGVSGVDVSFENQPEVTVSIRPMGLPVNDLPGVHEFLRSRIAAVFAASYVEPRRYYQDVERAYLSATRGADAGPSGSLIVDVAGAARLPATNKDSRTSNPYLEVTYAGVTRYTATRLNTLNPDWSVRLAFPLPEDAAKREIDAGGGGDAGGFGSPVPTAKTGSGIQTDARTPIADASAEASASDRGGRTSEATASDRGGRLLMLRVRVMDWSPLGEPRCIGSASYPVDVARLLANAARAGARKATPEAANRGGALGLEDVTLALRGTRGGCLRFSVGAAPPQKSSGWSSSTETRANATDSAWDSVEGRERTPAFARGIRGTAARAFAADLGDVWGDDLLDEDDNYFGGDDDDDDAYEDDFERDERASPGAALSHDSPGGPGPSRLLRNASASPRRRLGDVPSASRSGSFRRRGGAAASPSESGGAATNAAAAHLIQVAKLQRLRREDATRHAEDLAAARRKTRDARDDLAMERERRDFELRRALIEGAVFTCHTRRKPGFEPGTYRLWYNAQRGQLVWCAGAKPKGKPKLHQFVPASLVKECVLGTSAFTLGAESEKHVSRAEAVRSGPVGRARRAAGRAAASASSLLTKKIGHHDPLRCFSLVLWKPDDVSDMSDNVLTSGAAGLGLATIDLELPEGGNGRSAREWCDAMQAAAYECGGGVEEEDEDDDDDERARSNSPGRVASPTNIADADAVVATFGDADGAGGSGSGSAARRFDRRSSVSRPVSPRDAASRQKQSSPRLSRRATARVDRDLDRDEERDRGKDRIRASQPSRTLPQSSSRRGSLGEASASPDAAAARDGSPGAGMSPSGSTSAMRSFSSADDVVAARVGKETPDAATNAASTGEGSPKRRQPSPLQIPS